ncbi:MAG: NADH-quinone oxidoreductase subunit C [Nocardioidaceae bacterium]
MTWVERVQAAYDVAPDTAFGTVTVDVSAELWAAAARRACDDLGCSFFDFLTAVDELDSGFSVVAHVAAPGVGVTDALLLRTRITRDEPVLDCICGVYAGAAWHERETHEMFGVGFRGHDDMRGLLLPDGFEGHPLRKDFVLASRVVKPWPGAKEPGESDRDTAASPGRRRMRPPGVPDPGEWGQAAGVTPRGPTK